MSFLQPKPATSSSSSGNVNNGLITSTYGGQMGTGVGATNFLAQLLGVPSGGGTAAPASSGGTYFDLTHDGIPGDAAAARAAGQPTSGYYPATTGTSTGTGTGTSAGGDAMSGYKNYLQLAGYAPALTQLSKNITGQGAAAGILNSGSTAKALETQGALLNNQFFNNYMQQLAGLSGLGLQAGSLVSNAGQQSQSQSSGGSPSTLGSIASTVGGIASIFSDRRLKKNIVKIGEFADGLGKYLYRYKWDILGDLREGVMADEVAKLRPWALGPRRLGFATVNYGAL